MSLLDAHSEELISAAEQAPPPMQRKEPPKRFSTWGMFSAAPKGVAAGAAEGVGSTADILGAFGQVLATTGGSSKGMFATPTPEEKKQTNAATEKLMNTGIDYSSEAGRSFRNVSADYTPDAQTTHVAESAMFNLFRVGSKALTAAATLGNIPGAAVAGLEEGFTQSDVLAQQGVDLATRTKVGAVTAVTNAVGFALPVAGKTWLQTGALALAGGPASFVAQNAATREILQAADYAKLADQYDPLDPVGLALSTVLPLGFGALAMRGAKVKGAVPDAPKVYPPDDLIDAARVQLVRQNMDGTNPLPGDLAAADAHHKAYTQAMDQQAEGARVSVADIAPKIEPMAGKATDSPNFKAWFGESKVVDDTGAPMVMYRGTANQDASSAPGGMVYLSKSTDMASTYASGKDGGAVYPLFVKAENLVDPSRGAGLKLWTEFQKSRGKSWADDSSGTDRGALPNWQVADQFKKWLDDNGKQYDGLWFAESNGTASLAVKDASQLKSAIGNSGKFDPNSGSLTDNPIADWGANLKKSLDDMAEELAKIESKPAPAQAEPAQAATKTIAQDAGFNPAALANEASQMLEGGRPVAQVIGELEAGGTKITPELQNMLVGASEFGGRINELVDQVNALKAQRGPSAKPFDLIAQAVENLRNGTKVDAPKPANPLEARLAEMEGRNPTALDAAMHSGIDADGKPTGTMTARDYLDMIKKEAANDSADASLLEVAANCFISGGV